MVQNVSAVAGAWAPHARAVEFGGPYTRAQPFARRARERAKDEVLLIAALDTERYLREAVRRPRRGLGGTYLLTQTPGTGYVPTPAKRTLPVTGPLGVAVDPRRFPWNVKRTGKFVPIWDRPAPYPVRFGVSVRDQELLRDLASVTQSLTLERQQKMVHKGAKVVAKWMKKYTPYDPERTEGVHLRDTVFASTGRLGRKFPARRFG